MKKIFENSCAALVSLGHVLYDDKIQQVLTVETFFLNCMRNFYQSHKALETYALKFKHCTLKFKTFTGFYRKSLNFTDRKHTIKN